MPPPLARVAAKAGLWIAGGAALAAAAGLVVFRLASRSKVAGKAAAFLGAVAERRSAVLAAVAVSLVVQSAFVMTNVWLARQVGVTTALAAWFVAWPLSKLVAVLPISLGGIGVREAALVSLLVPYGAASDAVLASGILWQGVLIVTGVVGLAVTHWLPRRAAVPAVASPEKL
jgi:uncharacterized membrane protein YbhN (UPF0104 family)